MTHPDWHMVIRPNRLGSVIAVGLAWLLCLPLITWGILGSVGLAFAAMCAVFPVLISYYGLKSAFRRSGRIDIDSVGFRIQRPDSEPEAFAWRDVRGFFVGRFAASPVYDGQPVPHFEFANGSGGNAQSWLPANTGLSPEQLVQAMERLRLLAQAGWPTRPSHIRELLDPPSGPVT